MIFKQGTYHVVIESDGMTVIYPKEISEWVNYLVSTAYHQGYKDNTLGKEMNPHYNKSIGIVCPLAEGEPGPKGNDER